MDLVIRGRSQDQRGSEAIGGGWTRVEPGRTRGNQGRTRGDQGRSRGSPKEEQEAAAAAAVGCTPEGARTTGQGSSAEWPPLMQLSRASQPVMRGYRLQ